MSAMVENLNAQIQGGFRSDYDGRFARHVLEMLSMAYAIGFEHQGEGSAIVLSRQSEVVRYIEDNLRNPDLQPGRASPLALRISPRYLRTLFAARGEKASTYIVRPAGSRNARSNSATRAGPATP